MDHRPVAVSSREPTTPRELTGIILAGGKSSRMGGFDKAFLSIDGETSVARLVRLFSALFGEVVVVANQPGKYASIDVRVVADAFTLRGPLAGLHAGLRAARFPHAFVIACDMPFARAEPIRALIERIGESDAVIPCWEGDIEPLHAVYRCGLHSAIAAALDGGTEAVREFLPRIRVDYVPECLVRSLPGAEESFRNVNTPEDAARYALRLDRHEDARRVD